MPIIRGVDIVNGIGTDATDLQQAQLLQGFGSDKEKRCGTVPATRFGTMNDADGMKLLVFAHVPPPHHGQSYMVELMLEGFRQPRAAARADSTRAIECLHIDARYSDDLTDMGGFRLGKVARLLGYCARAAALRLRTGVRTLYFVPSPPRRVPLLRDIVCLFLVRPFFPRVILHWHAAGLGEWLETQPLWLRWPARALLGRADLSIALAESSEADALKLVPKRSVVVPYGIPDPIPDFATRLAHKRAERSRVLDAALTGAAPGKERIRVLFIALCTREKGLFDALDGIRAANQALAASGGGARFELHVAGSFPDHAEHAEFAARTAAPEWESLCHYHGFVTGPQKQRLLEEVDILLFPTFYSAESFPVVMLEAMAAGLPIVATRWRGIPEMLPADYPGLVGAHDANAIAAALREMCGTDQGLRLREHYLERFTLARYLAKLAEVMRSADRGRPSAAEISQS